MIMKAVLPTIISPSSLTFPKQTYYRPSLDIPPGKLLPPHTLTLVVFQMLVVTALHRVHTYIRTVFNNCVRTIQLIYILSNIHDR